MDEAERDPPYYKGMYVYVVTHPITGQFYIGARNYLSWGKPFHPQDDARYMGSGAWPKLMKQLGVELNKTVIAVYFDSTRNAERLEYDLIKLHADNPRCMNLLRRPSSP